MTTKRPGRCLDFWFLRQRTKLRSNAFLASVLRLELYTFVWRKGECQRDVAGERVLSLRPKTLFTASRFFTG